MEIPFAAESEVRAAIGRIGQTEDVQFSPDGRRLALAGFARSRILLVECAAGFRAGHGPVTLTDFVELDSPSLKHPHGLSWVDDTTLIVANRDGAVAIFELASRSGSRRLKLDPVGIIGADEGDLIATPGSISSAALGLGLIELLVCNNSLHQVSRHLVDRRNGYAGVSSEVLLEQGFDTPDGIAHSPTGRWVAVSNNGHHCVFIFRNDAGLGWTSKPHGVLRGLRYPHGLIFSGDETSLLVADSGTPCVHHFRSEDGDWSGEREPTWCMRVMDDATFERGRCSIQEGGPKGIDVTRDGRLMVTSCEERPLVFFDLGTRLAQSAGLDGRPEVTEGERARAAMLRLLAARSARIAEPAEAATRLREREIHKLINSRSYRLTAPLRKVAESLRRRRHRAGR